MSAPLTILALFTFLAQACAHGGGNHRWTLNPQTLIDIPSTPASALRVYWPVLAGVASSWKAFTNRTAIAPVYPFPYFPAHDNVTVSGTVGIYTYLTNNCTNSPQTALVPLLSFTQTKNVTKTTQKIVKNKIVTKTTWSLVRIPYGSDTHKLVYGYGFTGDCSAPGNLYRNNDTLQDNRFNLAYWNADNEVGYGTNATNGRPGYLWGAAPNSWFVRDPAAANATGKTALRSIIIVTEGGPTFCAPVDWKAAPSSPLSYGVTCGVVAPH